MKPSVRSTFVLLALVLLSGTSLVAQETEPEPEFRYITFTSFDVPFGERSTVIPFIEERFLPGILLDPKVKNFRMMTHNWGAKADEIVMIIEYENFEDIQGECAPCDAYYEENPEPEEGDEGYEEYQEALDAFNRAYEKHRDEIYVARVDRRAILEGQRQGDVGAPEEASD